MPVIISDETLKQAGLTESQAKIEVACILFDLEKLQLWQAAQLAGMDRVEFENELIARKIPIYRPTLDDLKHDVEVARRIGR